MVACTRPQKRLHPLVTLVILFSMLVGCTTPTPVVTPTEGEVSSPVPPTRTQSAQSPSSTLVEQTASPVPPTSTSTRVAQTVSTGRVDIEGDPWFLFGANYPWHSYGNDFGENAWGHNGVSSARTEVEADFEAMSAMGVRVVRWFIFTDGRAAPEFAPNGSVSGLDDKVFADLDAALDIAQKYNIRLILVLLDFHWLAPQKNESGVLIGGHADTITETAKRETFHKNALLPLLQRYGKHPYILAWEIINEPEWAMDDPDIQTDQSLKRVPPEAMQGFVKEAADLIHKNTVQFVTVGSASRRWWNFWEDSGLDLCQVHYYPWMEKGSPLNFPSGDLDPNLPCILGEFPASAPESEATFTLDQYYQTILDNGYAGAFPWSLRANDQYSRLDEARSTVQDWASRLTGTIEIPTPVGWVTPTLPPTQTPVPSSTPSSTALPAATSTPQPAPAVSLASPTVFAPGADPAMYGFELRDHEWVHQTYKDSQAVTGVSRVSAPVYAGDHALQMVVNLMPFDPYISKGEAFVDVMAFEPLDGSVGPYDMQNSTITCWMYLPHEAYAGNHSPWIGFQVFAKDEEFRNEYGSWRRVHVTHVDQWLRVRLAPRRYPPPDGYMDPGFDPSTITIIGVKIGVDDYYAEPGSGYRGPVFVDSCSWD